MTFKNVEVMQVKERLKNSSKLKGDICQLIALCDSELGIFDMKVIIEICRKSEWESKNLDGNVTSVLIF